MEVAELREERKGLPLGRKSPPFAKPAKDGDPQVQMGGARLRGRDRGEAGGKNWWSGLLRKSESFAFALKS